MNTSELYEISEQVDRELAGLWDGNGDDFALEDISTLVIVNDGGGNGGGQC